MDTPTVVRLRFPTAHSACALSHLAHASLLLLGAGALVVACSDSDVQRPMENRDAGIAIADGSTAADVSEEVVLDTGNSAADDGSAPPADVSVTPDSSAMSPDADAAPRIDASIVDGATDTRADVRVTFDGPSADATSTASLDARADTNAGVPQDATETGGDATASLQDSPVGPVCPLLIDDMESGSGHANDGCRNGFWFTYNSGADAGVQSPAAGATFNPEPLVPPRGTSLLAAHTSGSGYTFAGMGLNFASPPAGVTTTYDASAYAGITFFAMGSGAVTVMFPDRDTDVLGQVCMTADRGACNDHFARNIVLTSTWQPYTVLFANTLQQGFGYAPPGGFNKAAVYGVLWQASGTAPFDIWIDDLAFVAAGSAGTD